jgi:hypothetical protein
MLPDYTLSTVLLQNSHATIYRAVRNSDNLPVIIKTNTAQYPSELELSNLEHEYHLMKKLDVIGICRPIDLQRHLTHLFLILEDCNAISLKEWLAECTPLSRPSKNLYNIFILKALKYWLIKKLSCEPPWGATAALWHNCCQKSNC